jgi:hypothetical protein
MAVENLQRQQIFQVDRPLHHQLALSAYRVSFRYRNLTERYEQTEFRRLSDVFSRVQIADSSFPSIKRPVDTFDLINPLQASRLCDAIYEVMPSRARAVACFKAVDRFCRFLKDNPTIYQPGCPTLYLPALYGPIESPVNRYTILRSPSDRARNLNYLERGIAK